ncbi:hypothetical protein [Streptomyces chattanoogensis]|uniref:Uncharacterized protein n=1 Tax=Streptomyces chattanoogensis TaxID=66876 RepID=A0A0N0XSH1_9ACTN|nr:hypothetical protein [Streptomyces chattanoogensis]KPC60678.1 hypothetical protein ADL29_27950 [Streptomyces chattanoogensis]
MNTSNDLVGGGSLPLSDAAAVVDEGWGQGAAGGRALFVVAQLAVCRGCRYGRRGTTIWGERSLTATTAPAGLREVET